MASSVKLACLPVCESKNHWLVELWKLKVSYIAQACQPMLDYYIVAEGINAENRRNLQVF
jgi:hypothetical protein